jgi:hypothetical protein
MAAPLGGTVTVILRAPIPLDVDLVLDAADGAARLLAPDGGLLAEARRVEEDALTAPGAAPSLEAAQAAGQRFVGLERMFHPICFTCGVDQPEGFGLRVFTGPVEGDTSGMVAGKWIPNSSFASGDGLIPPEVVWAALDCPGSVAWVDQGFGGGLLGTVTARTLRRPVPGEDCIIAAWPLEASGRKYLASTALFTADGELLAHSQQIWISRARPPAV